MDMNLSELTEVLDESEFFERERFATWSNWRFYCTATS